MSDAVAPPPLPDDPNPGQVPPAAPVKKGMSGCMIALLVVGLGGLLLTGMLLVVAFAQYGDYVVRAQVSEGPSLAEGVETAVGEYFQNNAAFPQSNRNAELPEPRDIHGAYVSYLDIGKQPGHIEIGYSSKAPQRAHRTIDGKHLWFDAAIKDGVISWTCRSSELKQKDCPRRCACSG